MSNTYYDLYIASVKRFARTIVIKSEQAAAQLNEYLELYNNLNIDSTDPTSWKYYMNLAGQYHSTDKTMQVRSLDTTEIIDFTVGNLLIHRATAKAYQPGTSYYTELLRNYPDQEALIRGIANPIDISTAIAADDFTILWYDQEEVESTEQNLIPELQKWINAYILRWEYMDYAGAGEFYYSGLLAVMYVNIPKAVLSIRRNNCHTNYVHSYHIWSYLASNGGLDRFRKYLSTKQALWLYRNIQYLFRNVGKQSTFAEVIEKLLTDRGIPLGSYDLRHNVTPLPDAVLPDVEMYRSPLNLESAVSTGYKVRTVQNVLERQLAIAKDNGVVIDEQEIYTVGKTQTSLKTDLPTKVLESEVLDRTDAIPFKRATFLLNEWLHLATQGLYTASISITNPHNGDVYAMTVKEAFILYLYTANAAHGAILTTVPTLQAKMVRRIPTPTFAELRSMCEVRYVPDVLISQALTIQPDITRCVSTASFLDMVNSMHQALLLQRDLYVYRQGWQERGQTEGMVKRLYADVTCNLADGMLYTEWLRDRGWTLGDLSAEEYLSLSVNILNVATGQDLVDTLSLKDLQRAMLDIMGELSSYTIQTIQTINGTSIDVVDWSAIRVGPPKVSAKDISYIGFFPVRVRRLHGSVLAHSDPVLFELASYKQRVRISAQATIDPTVSVIGKPTRKITFRVSAAPVRVRDITGPDSIGSTVSNRLLDGLYLQPFPKLP